MIQISNISINFSNGQMGDVQVYFNSRYEMDDRERRINVNGNVLLTSQEYLQNSSTNDLLNIVQERVTNFVNEDTTETVETAQFEEVQENLTQQANNQTTTNNNTTDNNQQPRQARTRTNKQ